MQIPLPDHASLLDAAAIVHAHFAPTPQYAWPLLAEALGTEVWVKHENDTPTGAFKVRGGLVYFEELKRAGHLPAGVIGATRGNHGQSVGLAARLHGVAATIVVPHGNSREKNAAMRALGVNLIEHGEDFQQAREYAQTHVQTHGQRESGNSAGQHIVPSFHIDLVRGVASYWMELLTAHPDIDVVYVPVGQGSGICAAIAAREALGLRTRIIGVVSAHALAYKLSFEAGRVIEAPVTTRLADGMACRLPDAAALEWMIAHVERFVAVSDDEVAAAMRLYFTATHHVAEGAGAAALAAALQERHTLQGVKIGLPLSGANVDQDIFAAVLESRPC